MAGPAAGSQHRARQPGRIGKKIDFLARIPEIIFLPAFRINIFYALLNITRYRRLPDTGYQILDLIKSISHCLGFRARVIAC